LSRSSKLHIQLKSNFIGIGPPKNKHKKERQSAEPREEELKINFSSVATPLAPQLSLYAALRGRSTGRFI
jgi:hypothetical protein